MEEEEGIFHQSGKETFAENKCDSHLKTGGVGQDMLGNKSRQRNKPQAKILSMYFALLVFTDNAYVFWMLLYASNETAICTLELSP